jgi:hypothetical protein
MIFQVQSTISKLTTLSDNTVRLTVDCQELLPEEAMKVFELKGSIGWFLFKANQIEDKDVPEIQAEFKDDKTPSQRLRNTLYKYWELNTNKAKPFDNFYREWIEKKINEIKELLNG